MLSRSGNVFFREMPVFVASGAGWRVGVRLHPGDAARVSGFFRSLTVSTR